MQNPERTRRPLGWKQRESQPIRVSIIGFLEGKWVRNYSNNLESQLMDFSLLLINDILLSSACVFWSWDAVLPQFIGRRLLSINYRSHFKASTHLGREVGPNDLQMDLSTRIIHYSNLISFPKARDKQVCFGNKFPVRRFSGRSF